MTSSATRQRKRLVQNLMVELQIKYVHAQRLMTTNGWDYQKALDAGKAELKK